VRKHEIHFKSSTLNVDEVDGSSIERDPGLRPLMWEYLVNKRDEIRWVYLKRGPYQLILQKEKYLLFEQKKHLHRFQAFWFTQFSTWLKYSCSKDAAYCLPCYLFFMKTLGHTGCDAFTIKGCRSCKKIHAEKNCAFLTHIGEDPYPLHNNGVKYCEDLRNQSRHIDKVLNA
jgi:hypothetical protein